MIYKSPVGYRSLKEIVYDHILEALEKGRLKPGDRIREKEICEKLNVSRTPVREALLQLEPVGLVSFLPRQGIVVKDLTPKDLEELFDTIAPLEAAAARLATPHLTEKDFEKFERSLKIMEELMRARKLRQLNREMEAFHEIHLLRCPNQLLVSTIRLLKRRFYDVPHPIVYVDEWEGQLLSEHRQLIEIFRQRDGDNAARFLQRHWSWEHNKKLALRSFFPNGARPRQPEPRRAGPIERKGRRTA